jgi:hypothetical protein
VDLKLGHYNNYGIEVVDVEGEIDVYTATRLRELLSSGTRHIEDDQPVSCTAAPNKWQAAPPRCISIRTILRRQRAHLPRIGDIGRRCDSVSRARK